MNNLNQNSSRLTAGQFAAIIAATCLLLGNIYYAQPILYEIAASLQIDMDDSGLIVAFGQAGYITGLLVIAPLGDTLDNRKLCALMTSEAAIFTLTAATSKSVTLFYICVFLMGTFATSLAGSHNAGRTLGILACGLFLGIALSRPLSSFVTANLNWRYVYAISGAVLLAASVCLYTFLPRQRDYASSGATYYRIIREMLSIPIHTRHFLRYSVLSFFAFLGFTMFWSSAPLYLSENMKFGQNLITVFTMTGLITPPVMLLVGCLLDKGKHGKVIILALCLIILGWLAALGAPAKPLLFFLGAILIDPCSSATTVTVQKSILSSVNMEMRGRANSLNISINFLGGTLGAAMGPWLLGKFSWPCVALTGIIMIAGLLIFEIVNLLSFR